MENINALILNVRKNTGNTVIIDTYTREHGRIAFIYSFSKANKKNRAIVFPMNWISFSTLGKTNTNLKRISQLQSLHVYHSIGINPIKNLVVLFLSEVISSCIKEENPDKEMFNFFENALNLYDQNTSAYQNFHLSFLTGMLAMLGIAPPVDNKEVTDTHYAMWDNKMRKEEKETFKKICLSPLDQCENLKISSNERSRQLNIILDYYQHFAVGFKQPKSLDLFRDF